MDRHDAPGRAAERPTLPGVRSTASRPAAQVRGEPPRLADPRLHAQRRRGDPDADTGDVAVTTDRVTADGPTVERAAAARKVRRAQAVNPSGVGAIVDVVGESFVAEDVSRWRGRREVLPAPRVAALFNVAELRTPPAMEAPGDGIPFYRFPEWLFCGRCRVMIRWHPKREKPGQPPRCGRCPDRPPQLVPM